MSFLKNIYDNKKRKKISNMEIRKKLLKYLILKYSNNKNFYKKRNLLIKNFNYMFLNSLYIRAWNRCVISGRSKCIFTKYRLSRIKFKEYYNRGFIGGISWNK